MSVKKYKLDRSKMKELNEPLWLNDLSISVSNILPKNSPEGTQDDQHADMSSMTNSYKKRTNAC